MDAPFRLRRGTSSSSSSMSIISRTISSAAVVTCFLSCVGVLRRRLGVRDLLEFRDERVDSYREVFGLFPRLLGVRVFLFAACLLLSSRSSLLTERHFSPRALFFCRLRVREVRFPTGLRVWSPDTCRL